MELIPRVTVLFIEGLRPISEATRSLIARKFKGADGLNIGMSPALVIGHPTTLVVSILLIPVTLILAVVLTVGLYLVTNLAPAFTLAAKDVYAVTGDAAVAIPANFDGGSLDFASSPLAWVIYQCSISLKWIGAGILVLVTLALMIWNRVNILRNQKAMVAKDADTLQTME